MINAFNTTLSRRSREARMRIPRPVNPVILSKIHPKSKISASSPATRYSPPVTRYSGYAANPKSASMLPDA
jgi:hypothetical protein